MDLLTKNTCRPVLREEFAAICRQGHEGTIPQLAPRPAVLGILRKVRIGHVCHGAVVHEISLLVTGLNVKWAPSWELEKQALTNHWAEAPQQP